VIRFHVRFSFAINAGTRYYRPKGGTMSDWSQNVSRRLQEKDGEQQKSNEKIIQDRNILSEGLNAEWQNILGSIKKKCEEINEDNNVKIKLNYMMRGPMKIGINRQDTGEMITVERGPNNEAAFLFLGMGVKYTRKIFVRINPKTDTIFLADKDAIPIEESADELAAEIIETLLGL
jgi:hypothetical protein